MKTKIFVVGVAMALLFAVSAIAAEPPIAKVRIVDMSALSSKTKLDDPELMRLANLSAVENPKIFPFVGDFVLKSGTKVGTGPDATVECVLTCPIDISGSISEEEKLEFVSIPSYDKDLKFDIAIVKRDGKVVKVDKEIIVDYKNRTLNTNEPIVVSEGDIILTFVKEVKPIHFPTDKKDFPISEPKDKPLPEPEPEPEPSPNEPR